MPLRLSKPDQEFRNPLLFAGEAKSIDLYRVLLNLFMLIKYHGARPVARPGRKSVTIDTVIRQLVKREADGVVRGFEGNEEKVRWWVMTNLVDLVNRGNPEKEAVVSLRAIHLNSYKYRNPNHARDYNISEQVFNMLQVAQTKDLIGKLRDFLGQGWNTLTNALDTSDAIDLDTLGILRIVEKEMAKEQPSGDHVFRPMPCVCPGQAKVFADDVRRLLVYRQAIPRHVLLEYLRTLIGLHVGLYLFKLFKMLPDWVQRGQRDPACLNCLTNEEADLPYQECPYHCEFMVDCSSNPQSDMASLAEDDAAYYYARIHDYIRATFSINMALQYLSKTDSKRMEDIDDALSAIKNGGANWDEYFKIRRQNLFANLKDSEQEETLEVFKPILDLGLSNFETFIELVTQARASFHFKYHKELLDSLFQSNRENGIIWQGRSRRHRRRFWLSPRMLETMVQLSVLKSHKNGDGGARYSSEPILIDSFIQWMEARYGLIVNGVDKDRFRSAGIVVHQAFRNNLVSLKERLREIGFFSVLSDAYIMQRIRPRYHIENGGDA